MYINWAVADVGNPLTVTALPFTEEQQAKLLGFFSQAYSYNEKNSTVLQTLAKLGNSSYPPIAAGARQIYDPSVSQDLPPGVLNQLALEALAKERYEEAQQYYERANTLSPNSPSILNNLAYAYLKEHSEDNPLSEEERTSNASRGHRLIEQAIRLLPNNLRNSEEMSRYRHTMGTALMQLGNYPGAAAQFERALLTRPNEENLLVSVIECYQKYQLDAGPYQRRLDEVKKQEQNSSIN